MQDCCTGDARTFEGNDLCCVRLQQNGDVGRQTEDGGGDFSHIHPDRSTRARTLLVLQLLDRRDLVSHGILHSLAGPECGMLIVVLFGKACEQRRGNQLIALGERGHRRESRGREVSRSGSEGWESRGASERATGQEMNLKGYVGG